MDTTVKGTFTAEVAPQSFSGMATDIRHQYGLYCKILGGTVQHDHKFGLTFNVLTEVHTTAGDATAGDATGAGALEAKLKGLYLECCAAGIGVLVLCDKTGAVPEKVLKQWPVHPEPPKAKK